MKIGIENNLEMNAADDAEFDSRDQIARLRRTSRQGGLTLMEIALALVVVAVVIAGAIVLYRNGSTSATTQNEVGYLRTTFAEVKQLYGTSNDYGTSDITSTLVTTKAAPQSWIVNNNLQNSWNGSVTVTGNSSTFKVTTTNVPSKACIQLAQFDTNAVAVTVNGSSLAVPVTPAAASSACSSDTNTIAWNER